MKTIMINGKTFCQVGEMTIEQIKRCFPMAKIVIEIPIGWNIVI